jgi:hypothetical protein
MTKYEHAQVEMFSVECDGLPLWDGQKNEGL